MSSTNICPFSSSPMMSGMIRNLSSASGSKASSLRIMSLTFIFLLLLILLLFFFVHLFRLGIQPHPGEIHPIQVVSAAFIETGHFNILLSCCRVLHPCGNNRHLRAAANWHTSTSSAVRFRRYPQRELRRSCGRRSH